MAAALVKAGCLTEHLKHLRLHNFDLSSSYQDDIRSLLSVCSENLTVVNSKGCKIFPYVRSRKLEITNQDLSNSETTSNRPVPALNDGVETLEMIDLVIQDTDTNDLVTAMRDRVETVVMGDSVTLDTDSMARYLPLIERTSKCRTVVVPEKYKYQVDAWRDIVKCNKNISMFMTPQQAEDTAEKIREAGEESRGYKPSVSDIRVAADLVNTGYLTKLKYSWLEDLALSASDEADIKSLLSVCTGRVTIRNVRGCDLIIKYVNGKELWIYNQTLSASETADLVTSMRDRVERLVLEKGVTLDVETVYTRIGELRQGTCTEIVCWNDTRDKYREHLTRWADTIGWRTEEDINS